MAKANKYLITYVVQGVFSKNVVKKQFYAESDKDAKAKLEEIKDELKGQKYWNFYLYKKLN